MYLAGCQLGSWLGALTNSAGKEWVRDYQTPFNNAVLNPAAQLAQRDPAGAYSMLSAGFDKIKQDAVTWVNSFPLMNGLQAAAQERINGWKTSDWPLINGFLNDWSKYVAGTPTSPAPAVFNPVLPPQQAGADLSTIGQPVFMTSPVPATAVSPAAFNVMSPAPVVNVSSSPGTAADSVFSGQLGEWLPYIGGAVLLGLLLSQRRAGK